MLRGLIIRAIGNNFSPVFSRTTRTLYKNRLRILWDPIEICFKMPKDSYRHLYNYKGFLNDSYKNRLRILWNPMEICSKMLKDSYRSIFNSKWFLHDSYKNRLRILWNSMEICSKNA